MWEHAAGVVERPHSVGASGAPLIEAPSPADDLVQGDLRPRPNSLGAADGGSGILDTSHPAPIFRAPDWRRVAMTEARKLAAILVTDIVGFSRLAGADEDRILARLRALRSDLIDPTIAVHRGRVVKRTGDGAIVEFRSVVDAVRCAIEMQQGLVERNAGLPPERRIDFRVGIHLGDVVEEADGDLMGDGVNIAARLEGIAKPGAICLSEDAYRPGQGPARNVGQRSRADPAQEHRRAGARLFCRGRPARCAA